MKKRSVSAQVTLFFILGLVLFAVFAFALYARNMISSARLQAEAHRAVVDSIQQNSLQYYVEDCLHQVTNQVLLASARQGGRLNFSGLVLGEDILPLRLDVDGVSRLVNVSYGLLPNTRCSVVALTPPQYPHARTFLSSLPLLYERADACHLDVFSGFIGMNVLPKLCDAYGPNAYAETPNVFSLACRPGTYGFLNDTIQNDLQVFATRDLRRCVNFSLFEDLLGSSISVDEAGLSFQMIFAKDGVVARATYPFSVVLENGKTILTSYDFSYRSPYRFRKVYDYVLELIRQENRHHNFVLSEDFSSVRGFDPSFDVEVVRDPCSRDGVGVACPDDALFDDLLVVRDKGVVESNRSLVFQVMLKDRAPMLDYIHKTLSDAQFDLKVGENETLLIEPEGFDPDDGPVSYAYSGWYEDYHTLLNFSCCSSLPGGRCNISTFRLCIYNVTDGFGNTFAPHNWSSSSLFRSTNRLSSINLSRNDTGIHEVTVTVTDDSGKFDFQRLKILVFDLPRAFLNFSNGFVDINDSFASIEDPFLVDGSKSVASTFVGEHIAHYRWSGSELVDGSWLRRFLFSSDDASFMFPSAIRSHVPFFDASGDDIRLAPLNVSASFPSRYRLQLVVSMERPYDALWSDPSSREVKVYQCLPHRQVVSPGSSVVVSDPYPYNTSDSFSYNHTCCQGSSDEQGNPLEDPWGVPFDRQKVCHEEFWYGSFHSLRSLLDKHISSYDGVPVLFGNPSIDPPGGLDDIEFLLSFDSSESHADSRTFSSFDSYMSEITTYFDHNNYYYPYSNDVFQMHVIRYCDGARGNTCTGPMKVVFTRINECPDLTRSTDNARCSGKSSLSFSRTPLSSSDYRVFCGYYASRANFEHAFFSGGSPYCHADSFCFPSSRGYVYSPEDISSQQGPFSCHLGCSWFHGSCSVLTDCQCSYSCGAECVSSDDFSFDEDALVCHYGCSEADCSYHSEAHCPSFAIGSVNQEDVDVHVASERVFLNAINNPFVQHHDPGRDEWCYWDPSCSSGGCSFQRSLLRRNACDECSASGVVRGELFRDWFDRQGRSGDDSVQGDSLPPLPAMLRCSSEHHWVACQPGDVGCLSLDALRLHLEDAPR